MAVATKFEELIAWQLATQFMKWAYEVSERGPMLDDPQFRKQWRDAAGSVPRNLSKGFIKYDPPEFARYVNIAKGSLGELQNDMLQGRPLGYFAEVEYTKGWRLLCRALKATNRLHKYLRSCGKKGPQRNREEPCRTL
jgi:four helix bundle protein